MFKKLLIILLVFLLHVSFVMPANCQQTTISNAKERDSLLARIQAAQSSFDTLQAPFTEERRLVGLNKPLTFEGKLFLNRQGLLFLTYLKPVKHILRVKGDIVLFYVEGSKTADQITLSAKQNEAPRPDFFQLDITNFNGTVQEDEKGYYLKQGSAERKISVMLDKKDLLARRIEILSESGDITKIFIIDPVVNKPLPNNVNNFRLPEGTKINVMGR